MVAILLVVSTSAVTWLWTSLRSRSRTTSEAEAWRREQEELLAEMATLQDDVARARVRATQVTKVTVGWSEGYKQGCDDMIRALTALQGRAVVSRDPGESSGPP
jgi:type II secretory pathway component PulJ